MLIVGAKGFAKELLEAILQNDENRELAFFDDISRDLPELLFGKYPIIKSLDSAAEYFREKDGNFALGIGSPKLRFEFYEKFTDSGGSVSSVISPFARIGRNDNHIGQGVNILTNVVIESSNSIGKGSLIHVGTLISHDVEIGEFCEISPRVNLLGNVTVGNLCRLGTGSTILPKVKIGNNVTVGAGAVVTKDVPDYMTVIGVPAKPLLR